MQAQGKTCIVARAWRMMTQDSSEISGLEDDKVAHPEKLPVWTGMQSWPGGFIQTLEARADEQRRSGKGIVWLHNDTDMVEGAIQPILSVLWGWLILRMVSYLGIRLLKQSGRFLIWICKFICTAGHKVNG
jgi:hypothetical protein